MLSLGVDVKDVKRTLSPLNNEVLLIQLTVLTNYSNGLIGEDVFMCVFPFFLHVSFEYKAVLY